MPCTKVPESVRRIACGTSGMSYSPPKPTVRLFIRVTSSISMTTIFPLYVVLLGAPAVIGTVARRSPSRRTCMVCAAASTSETWLRPMVNENVLYWSP